MRLPGDFAATAENALREYRRAVNRVYAEITLADVRRMVRQMLETIGPDQLGPPRGW